MNQESFSFVVYMIHACANKWRKMPSDVYDKIHNGDYGVQYLDYKVLVQILFETEPELFRSFRR